MLAHRIIMARAGIGGGVSLPVGLILLHNNAAIPSGWQRFSAADGRMIVGAGGSYGVGATGGSWSTGAIGSGSAGGHSGHGTQSLKGWGGLYPAGLNNSAGAHAHTVYPTYVPYRQAAIMIKAVTPGKKVPANAVVLATGALTGLSAVFNNGYYLMGYSSVGPYSPQLSGSVAAAGSHNHGVGSPTAFGGSWYDAVDSGSHGGHAAALSLQADYIKRVVMRALSLGVEYDLQSGMYGFWEGATAPEGWVIETSIADYFIQISSGGTGTVSGNNTVTLSGTLNSYDAYHHHYTTNCREMYTYEGTQVLTYNQALNWAHSHSIGAQTVSFLMPYYALKIIRYVG